MLYLILPPIIIVVTLVALVYFFSRRFPHVEKEIAMRMNDHGAVHTPDMRILESIKGGGLSLLEHLAQWSKVIALRTYNGLHAWTQSLREKKSRSVVRPVVQVSDESQAPSSVHHAKSSAMAAASVLKEHVPAPKPPIAATESVAAAAPVSQGRLQRVRPMISTRMTRPEIKPKPKAVVAEPTPAPVKNQLEDILVERIAANPRDLEAYERLGEYYMEQGNVSDAKECYRQVLRLSPVHRLAKIKIRRLEKLLEQK